MSTYDVPEMNGTGFDEVLTEVATEVNVFFPTLLVFIFGLVFITGYRKQRLTSGTADVPLWATIASICSTVVALILANGANLISLEILVVNVIITILFASWLFFSRDK